MTTASDPVLAAITQAAVGATGASHGWLLRVDGGELEVAAAVGDGASQLVGRRVPAGSGTAGYVAASGQPLALAGSAGDARLGEGVVAELGQRPASVLCVPCADDEEVVGALELIDKNGGERFSFDDVELVTLLGSIAAPALTARGGGAEVPSPNELARELSRLADGDPSRYATVAGVIEALLGAR
jgi:GAF domain-containing protein